MDQYALLFASMLNAGTVLAIAALGLLINEKAGIVNLGAEGMMLCAAIAGFAAVVHTGSDWLGFLAGMGARNPRRVRNVTIRPPELTDRPSNCKQWPTLCTTLVGRGDRPQKTGDRDRRPSRRDHQRRQSPVPVGFH